MSFIPTIFSAFTSFWLPPEDGRLGAMSAQRQGTTANIYRGKFAIVVAAVGVFSFLMLWVCIWLLYCHNADWPVPCFVVNAVWVVGVPSWFFLEHVYLFPKYGNHDQVERFDRTQELAAKIWAGGIVVLAAAWSSKF